jgi:hypothetical protein
MPRLLPVIILLPLAGFSVVNNQSSIVNWPPAAQPAPTEATPLFEKARALEAVMAASKDNRFVGAASCGPCHTDQAGKQLASNMARAAFSPKEHPLFDRFKNEAARLSGFRFLFLWERDPFEISVSDGVRELRIPAQWALGAGVHGVTFVARLGKGKYLEYVLTYYSHTGRLDFTPGQGDRPSRTLAEAAGQPNSRDEAFRCLSCHTTGSVDSPGADDIRVGELGVRCEACHGPGLLHLEAAKREDWAEVRRQIRNPGRSTAIEVLRLCGGCHREPPADARQVNWKDPANARFQPVGLSQSRCFLQSDGKLSCLTCHDSHSDVRRAEPKFYVDICARCHNPAKSPPAANCSATDCVGCHMPRVQAISHMEFSNHWIGIYSSSNRLVPAR